MGEGGAGRRSRVRRRGRRRTRRGASTRGRRRSRVGWGAAGRREERHEGGGRPRPNQSTTGHARRSGAPVCCRDRRSRVRRAGGPELLSLDRLGGREWDRNGEVSEARPKAIQGSSEFVVAKIRNVAGVVSDKAFTYAIQRFFLAIRTSALHRSACNSLATRSTGTCTIHKGISPASGNLYFSRENPYFP